MWHAHCRILLCMFLHFMQLVPCRAQITLFYIHIYEAGFTLESLYCCCFILLSFHCIWHTYFNVFSLPTPSKNLFCCFQIACGSRLAESFFGCRIMFSCYYIAYDLYLVFTLYVTGTTKNAYTAANLYCCFYIEFCSFTTESWFCHLGIAYG